MTRISTVTATAAPPPKAFSTTVEATCAPAGGRLPSACGTIDCHGIAPSTPICISTYSAATSRIEITIERGSVRAGSTTSSPIALDWK